MRPQKSIHSGDGMLKNITQELNLAWCKHIDDEGLGGLPQTLRGLSLEDNAKNISDKALYLICSNAKALRVLNLVGCDRITDEGLRWLPKTLQTLCLGLRYVSSSFPPPLFLVKDAS